MNEADLNALYDRNRLEIFALYQRYEADWKERIRKHEEDGAPKPTIEDRVTLKMGECDELIDLIQSQKRMIEFIATGKTEPVVHSVKAVVVGRLGAG